MLSKLRATISAPAVWISLLSLIWAAVLLQDLLPPLRGNYGWAWPYQPVLAPTRTLPLIVGVLCYVPVALWLRKVRAPAALIVWATFGGMGLALGAVYVRGDLLYRLYSITVSGQAAGWHMAAAHITNLSATLRNWPEFMLESASFSPHIDHSPPGIVLIYYLSNRLLERLPGVAALLATPLHGLLCQYLTTYTSAQQASAWIGMLMPVWSSATVFPIYYLGKRIFSAEAARWAALWWPLVPALLMFAPLPNTFFALPAFISTGLLWEGLHKDRIGWVVASGLLTSVLTFLTFTFLPLLLFGGLLTLGSFWLKRRATSAARQRWYWPIQMGMWYAVGLSAVWIVYHVGTGSNVWGIWRYAQDTQIEFARLRPYWPWLASSLNDFFMFSGWPLSLLAIVGVWVATQAARSEKGPGESDVIITAAAATLIVFDLLGTPRGETGRILLFLSPWLLFAAAGTLRANPRGAGLVTAMQGVVVIIMIISLNGVTVEFNAQAAPIPLDVTYPASGPARQASSAVFNDDVSLASYAGEIGTQVMEDGKVESFLNLWLTWDVLRQMNTPYVYSIQAVSSDGHLIGSAASVAPFGHQYPMTCWKSADGALTDRIRVPLPETPKGELRVQLQLVDKNTGQRLDVLTSDGSRNRYLELGPFHG
jgi:hypothetical protein